MKLTEKEFLDWKIDLLESDLGAIAQILEIEKDLEDVEKNRIEAEINLIKRWIEELKVEQK